MLHEISKHLSLALDMPIYTDLITQNFKAPGFILHKQKKTMKRALHQQVFITETFEIAYYLESENHETLLEMENKLFLTLSFFPYKGGLLRTDAIDFTYDQKKLTAIVNYAYFAKQAKTSTDLMTYLETIQKG